MTVECNEHHRPITLSGVVIETILESWRIDDEWWRQPIARCYHAVLLEGGKRVVLFEDIVSGEWFAQMP